MKANPEMKQRVGKHLRRSTATGLLLSLMLAAIPFTGFGQGVIATSVFTGVDLNVTFPAYNSATVLPGVIVSAGAGTNGITGSTHTWDVTVGAAGNPSGATVNGGASGIELTAGGTVTNHANSSIAGGTGEGVHISGGTGIVDNSGSISGGSPSGNDGVDFDNGGTVHNRVGGTIYGNDSGVDAQGGVTTVNNAGTITGQGRDGVRIRDGGSVYNLSGGNITGADDGVHISGGSGYVSNTNGTIQGNTGDGVLMTSGGTVDNLLDGTITGDQYGVNITGSATVNNSGLINGDSRSGVRLRSGGTVNNFAGGSIVGDNDGVHTSGSTATVNNFGSITGEDDNGVQFDDDGYLNNNTGGTVSGDRYGVEANDYTEVRNAGSITGDDRSGVRMRNGGYVYNGYDNNTGSYLGAGTITGAHDGVHASGVGASVYNYENASITGTGDNGIQFDDASGYAENYGTITGSGADGIQAHAGATVYNYSGGTITGSDDGVYVEGGSGYVENSGGITGNGDDGIRFQGGGSVYNYGGTIYGNNQGVDISGGSAYVYNAGAINGGSSTALRFGSSGDRLDLDTGSSFNGDINARGGIDSLFLFGTGSEDNNFLNFETLTMLGSNWELSGNNTFTNGVTVGTGLLRITGTLTTPLVVVSNGASLGGNPGAIVADILNDGTLSPGNSIGTLTVLGSLTNNGDYWVEVNAAGQADNTLISSNAIINGGNVIVAPSNGLFGPTVTVSILTASNGIYGAFTGAFVTNKTLFWSSDVTLTYLDDTNLFGATNSVDLTLNRQSFASVAKTHNQKAVAGSLDGLIDPIIGGANAGFSNTINTLFEFSNTNSFLAALDSLSGEVHGTLGMAAVQQHDAFVQSVALRTGRITSGGDGGYASAKRMQLAANGTMPAMEADTQKPWELWAGGYGSWADFDSDGNAAGGDFDIWGFNGGLDYTVSPELLLGFALGYSHNNLNTSRGSGEIDALQFAGYGSFVHGPWHFDGVASYGHLNNETKRGIFDGSTAKAKYDGNIFGISVEGGYAFEAGPITIQPTIGIKYTHLGQDSFREKGAGAAGLDVSDVEMDSIRASGGVRLTGHFGHKIQFIPEIRAAWEHEFADRTADVNAEFIGDTATSASFTSRGLEIGADSGVVGAGFKVAFNKTIAVFANYNARINEQFTSQTVSGGLSVGW